MNRQAAWAARSLARRSRCTAFLSLLFGSVNSFHSTPSCRQLPASLAPVPAPTRAKTFLRRPSPLRRPGLPPTRLCWKTNRKNPEGIVAFTNFMYYPGNGGKTHQKIPFENFLLFIIYILFILLTLFSLFYGRRPFTSYKYGQVKRLWG